MNGVRIHGGWSLAESFGENGEKDERKVRENGEEREKWKWECCVTNELMRYLCECLD